MVEQINQTAIIIDNGQGMCKGGLAGQDAPPKQFPSVIRRPIQNSIQDLTSIKEYYIGEETSASPGEYTLSYPIQNGVITNWDNMEKIWSHCFFQELKVQPDKNPCLITEAPLNTKSHKEKIAQIMFETFNCQFIYVSLPAVLSLFGLGKTTGLVLDSGEGITYSVPIYEGYTLPHTILKIQLAGKDLTNYLAQLLNQQGISLNIEKDFLIARNIKEKLCYIALDYNQEKEIEYKQSQNNEKLYQMPDGKFINIKEQRFICPELLFDPTLFQKQCDPVHYITYNSIMKCEIDIRKELYQNIILSGGSTMFSGFQERFQKEIEKLAPSSIKVNVLSPQERQYSAWVGGSILSNLSSFQEKWVTRQEYQENGLSVIHKKCF